MTENKNNQTTQIHTPTNHAPETVPAEWVLASKFEELAGIEPASALCVA